MMRTVLFLPLLLACAHGNAQCTHDNESPAGAHKAEQLADDDAVWDIPIVVHVLYGSEVDSVPADMIRTVVLDSVNADFRRTNWDTIYTQTGYRPISVDTRIQFRFATTDPDGNPTDGITYRQTDGQDFSWGSLAMMRDSMGGRDPWDVCSYINIWVCNYQGGEPFAENTSPWTSSERKGVVASPSIFSLSLNYSLYRHLTHFLGHFFGLRDFPGSGPSCEDNDEVEDTPAQGYAPQLDLSNPDSIYVDTICNPPLGKLACNFMMQTNAWRLEMMNMFTEGQKARMREMAATYYPGFIDASACWPAALEETAEEVGLLLHPNPTTSSLRFEAKTPSAYTITDMMGRTVQQGHVLAGQNELQVAALPDGIYLIRLEGTVAAARFVKGGE